MRLTILLGTAIALLTWPLQDFTTVQPGDDGSWVIGLHMASRLGLDFGREIAWTYGPLGFLSVPVLSYPLQGALSLLYVSLVQAGLGISALWAARRSLPLGLAVPAAAVTCVAVPITLSDDSLSAAFLTATFIWCLAVVRSPPAAGGAAVWAFPVATGVLSGLQVLVRLNAGLTLVLLCAMATILAFPGRRVRALAVFGAASVLTALALWLLSGQAVGDLAAYAVLSLELISGHSEALGTEDSPAWEYLVAAGALALLVPTAVMATRGWSRAARVGSLAMAALLMFSAFKQGFVRHDDSHTPFFFACALGVGLAFGWPRARPAIGASALAALLVAFAVVARPPPGQVAPPGRSPLRAVEQLRAVLSPRFAIPKARERLRAQEGLDPRAVELLSGRTVHIWPTETAVAWAYPEMSWRPIPTLQTKIAYTPRLDRLDARALESDAAPKRILRARDDDPFEAPATGMALFCRYAQLRTTRQWQVLARVPDRCGPRRFLRRVPAYTAERIPIPPARPDEMVVARIDGVQGGALERVVTFLFRARKWKVEMVDGGDYDLAPGTAAGPVMLRVPRRFDYPRPFSRSPARGAMLVIGGRLLSGQTSDDWHHRVTIAFYAVRLRTPAVAARDEGDD